MNRLRLCLLLTLLLHSASSHSAPTIGIYTDVNGTQCTGTTTNGFLQGSVWANGVDGITGAEFDIFCNQYLNHNLTLVFASEPGSIQVGDPLLKECVRYCWWTPWGGPVDSGGGTNLAFTACQGGSRVRLFTFVLIEKAPTQDIAFHIMGHGINGLFNCPLITLCDAPAYTKLCVNDTNSSLPDAIINPQDGSAVLNCPSASGVLLSVQQASWSAVKSLYR